MNWRNDLKNQSSMENTRLKDIIERYSKDVFTFYDESKTFIIEHKKRLTELLLKISRNITEEQMSSDAAFVISLTSRSLPCVRYGDIFYNTILVNGNQIRLSFIKGPFDNICELPFDGYDIDLTTPGDYHYFIYNLEPLFKDAGLDSEYERTLKNTPSSYHENPIEYHEEFADYFCEVYNKFSSELLPVDKKKFILLPYGAAIYYRNRFHNCIIIDDYSLSFGYLRNNNDNELELKTSHEDDQYHADDDTARYIRQDFSLIHETTLRFYYDHLNIMTALSEIEKLCGKEMEDGPTDLRKKPYGQIEVIHQNLVDYKKTIFTEKNGHDTERNPQRI